MNKKEILLRTTIRVLRSFDYSGDEEDEAIINIFSRLSYRQIMYIVLILDKEGRLNRERFTHLDLDEITFEKIQLCIL